MEQEEAQLRVLQEERSNLLELTKTVGWIELMKIGAEQLALRLPGALSKTENIGQILGKEFEKGEIAGIELFCSLPKIRIASLDEDINKLEGELGYESGERTNERDDSGGEGGAGGEGTFEGDAPRV